jgi:hypothetical protein
MYIFGFMKYGGITAAVYIQKIVAKRIPSAGFKSKKLRILVDLVTCLKDFGLLMHSMAMMKKNFEKE